jgi:glycosyltransferase involved in cell wall biosynthesis
MGTPTLSVVIPTYQRAELLRRSISSVTSQGDDFLEIIVADDASPDDTQQVLAALRSEEPRLRHVRRSVNGGNAATRNAGVAEAQGEWVTFLDDDDEMLPGFLAAMRSALATAPPNVGFAWCGVQWANDSGNGDERILREEVWNPEFGSREAAYQGFLRHRRIGTNCGLTIRRSAFQELGGFDETLRAAVDTDLLIRAAQRYDFAVVPQVYIKVHLHENGHVRRDTRARAETYDRIVEKHKAALQQAPAIAAALFYKAGWLHYHAGDKAGGRKQMLRALLRQPLSLKSWTALAGFELFGRRAVSLHEKLASLRTGRERLAHEER